MAQFFTHVQFIIFINIARETVNVCFLEYSKQMLCSHRIV